MQTGDEITGDSSDSPPRDDERVIHLAFDNPNAPITGRRLIYSCPPCGNKTWVLVKPVDKPESFAACQCAACGHQIGYVGWLTSAEPLEENQNGK